MENTLPWIEHLPCGFPGHTLHIVADVELGSHRPVAEFLAKMPVLGQQPHILESLFPEVRTLAYLLAAGGSPSRVDWLTARVVVFRLNHLVLTMSELALMDQINQKLVWLSRFLGLELAQLRSFALRGHCPGVVCHGAAELRLATADAPVATSLMLRGMLKPWLLVLEQAWQRGLTQVS